MLESLLKGHGYEVVCARNGEEALQKLRSEGADVIVSDILMPAMDGYMLCREVKADPALKGIPFVFYTATYTDPKDSEFGLGLGADRFLVKPMEPEEILEALSEVIASRPARPPEGAASPVDEEMRFLRRHNETLFRKLEKKLASWRRRTGNYGGR
jgi:CheY-like chemotaxis protein